MEGRRLTANPRQYYEHYWSDGGYHPRGGTSPALRRLLQTHIVSGWECLDVGCGDGRTAGLWIREHGCTYVGVDISQNAVDEARALGLDARRIDDATSLPFASETFDAVVCVEVLEHLFQPHLAAAEMLRVVKPGGLIVATVPNVAYWRRRVDLMLLGRWNPFGDSLSVAQPWRDPHIRFFNPGSLKRMLVSVGFERVRVGGHGGSALREIPRLGKRFWQGEGSAFYRVLERAMPSFFGCRLHALAFRPRESRPPPT